MTTPKTKNAAATTTRAKKTAQADQTTPANAGVNLTSWLVAILVLVVVYQAVGYFIMNSPRFSADQMYASPVGSLAGDLLGFVFKAVVSLLSSATVWTFIKTWGPTIISLLNSFSGRGTVIPANDVVINDGVTTKVLWGYKRLENGTLTPVYQNAVQTVQEIPEEAPVVKARTKTTTGVRKTR